ncbi:hypothetical protein [Corynebacterium argentoratense]|uniref:hypothetical protein n=1 Tax=Corynebacterium argentoratense TaxID=42817 RepID=UPI00248F139B|nr:hypothetical protein [Corynebacterium argentoratense]
MRLSPTTAPVLKGTAWASLSGAMLCVTLATGSGIAVAEGDDAVVVTDHQADQCVVQASDQSSPLTKFWSTLESDAKQKRLDQLDEADPGLGTAIRNFTMNGPAGEDFAELQRRMDAVGAKEGIGQLIDVTAEDAGVDSSPLSDQLGGGTDKTQRYSREEALSAAAGIGDNPAEDIAKALDSQAASGTELDKLRAQLFHDRAGDFNSLEHDIAEGLQRCAKELDPPSPVVTALKFVIPGLIGVGIIAMIVRAVSNSRKPSRHSA